MGYREFLVALAVIGCANAQLYNVCVQDDSIRCQNLEIDGSQVSCTNVPTRAECAIQMSRGAAQVGLFTEEELFLLGQRYPNEFRVLATVRDVNQLSPYMYEVLTVVPNNHTNGFEGLRGGRYCHPGLGPSDMRFSPRVLRALETLAARTDRCSGNTSGKTAEELEVENLSGFFSQACRPGPWSYNATVDADLKRRFPNLCAMCSANGVCAGYNNANAINVAGVQNSNSHIQALDCLVTNGTVAFAAWTHVRQFFMIRNPQNIGSFSALCEDGSLRPLTQDVLASPVAPCSLVRQPWSAIVSTTASSEAILVNLRSWWTDGINPGGNSWQSNLYSVLAGGSNARVVFEGIPLSPLNYTRTFRNIPDIDATTGCLPARRWCTTSAQEQDKCAWVRAAAYTLGLQPTISCQQRTSVFDCLADVRDDRADFFSADSHYGYLARRHFRLSPVKLVQNLRNSTSRVVALVKDANTAQVSRFENLRDKVACFPEFGGIAYVAFLRIAQERGVISANECDYARAVGEFFSGSCAPGALDAAHSLSDSSTFNSTNLCTACRPAGANGNNNSFTCSWDSTNAYYGNSGSLNCLSDPATDVAFVETQNIVAQLAALGINGSSFRALCADNTLAASAGVAAVPDACLIAHVVDAEILTRRNDAIYNSVNSLLDSLDRFFGYNVPTAEQLINIRLYSAFNGTNDLLFKDSTIGLTEATTDTSHQPAKNYIELFRHLEGCTSSAPSPTNPNAPGSAARLLVSVVTMTVTGLLTRYVVY